MGKKLENKNKDSCKAGASVQSLRLLIHVALLHEAWPVIRALGLKQHETQPHKVFRCENTALVVSEMGAENTAAALRWIFEKASFRGALNIGTAGCSESTVPLGEAVAVSRVGTSGKSYILLKTELLGNSLRTLPLISVENAVCAWEEGPTRLADMEGSAIVEAVVRHMPLENLGLIKIVSDYGSDNIPIKEETQHRVAQRLED